MAKPATRQQLIDYSLRKLGAPVLEINVDDDQIDDLVDDAIQLFQDRHFDGVEKMYLKYELTQNDIDRGRGFLYEGYWKKNRLWEGIYRDENVNKITHKYIDGIRVATERSCEKNLLSGGWYLCEGGDKVKPIRYGRFDQLGNQTRSIYI